MACASWPTHHLSISPCTITTRRHGTAPRAGAVTNYSSSPADGRADLPRLILHDSLDAAGIDTTLARAARKGFSDQIRRMTSLNAQTSIVLRAGADLAVAALQVAAEDDSLVSHSSVPLPVDAFVERLDDLPMEFCTFHVSRSGSRAPPEVLLENLEWYLYAYKGFHRAVSMSDTRALYLHSVLTCRTGSALMLSLIYSEMLKVLKMYGLLNFEAEIYFPDDLTSLPRGYDKKKSQISVHQHVMTSKLLLMKILRDLKDAFWPFQYDHSSSLFLRAARAANNISGPINNISGSDIASAKAAHYRLERGVWTNARFGDMRRALSACERLIILDAGYAELRDYAILLYHCGFFEQCLQFLKLYQTLKDSCTGTQSKFNQTDDSEEDVVVNLITRVTLILQEEGWTNSKAGTNCWGKSSEPW